MNCLSQIQNPRQGPNTRQSAGLFHACVNHCNDGSLRRFYYNIMCTEKGRSSVVASIVAAFEKRKKKKGLYFSFRKYVKDSRTWEEKEQRDLTKTSRSPPKESELFIRFHLHRREAAADQRNKKGLYGGEKTKKGGTQLYTAAYNNICIFKDL